MDIVRLVMFTAPEDAIAGFREESLSVRVADVTVETLGWTTQGEWLILARCQLGSLATNDGIVALDLCSELADVDAAIHSVVAMLTVTRRVPFSACAVNPTIGVLGDGEELRPLNGLRLNVPAVRVAACVQDRIELDEDVAHALRDRLDGAALLAEAISHENSLGRYVQLLRVLELAFGRGIGKFDAQLQQFLRDDATRHWFTPNEIHHWVSSRPRVMHADRSDRPIWYQRDVALTVNRLQEAVFDVVFNKANWRSPDSARRTARVPRRGSIDQSAGVFLTRGLDFSNSLRVLDPMGAFPMFLGGSIERAVPFGLWAVASGDTVMLRLIGQRESENASVDVDAFKVEPARLAAGMLMVYGADDDDVRRPEMETQVDHEPS